jgi:hypothetical protein
MHIDALFIKESFQADGTLLPILLLCWRSNTNTFVIIHRYYMLLLRASSSDLREI